MHVRSWVVALCVLLAGGLGTGGTVPSPQEGEAGSLHLAAAERDDQVDARKSSASRAFAAARGQDQRERGSGGDGASLLAALTPSDGRFPAGPRTAPRLAADVHAATASPRAPPALGVTSQG